MNVVLTARHERFVANKVKSGAYASAEEVINDGLRLLEAEDARQRRMAWLGREIEKGFMGPTKPWSRRDVNRVRRLVRERNGVAT